MHKTPHFDPARPHTVPRIAACALFMQNLDATAVTTALPQIARSLGRAPLELSLVVSIYVLALAVCLPIGGWLADRFGARRVFVAALGSFAFFSACCALSSSLTELVIARTLQGASASLMGPIARLLVLQTVPKDRLIRANAQMALPALVGPVTGPLVGGFMATYLSWHWIFLINIPIGLLGIALSLRFIPDLPGNEPDKLDPLGLVLCAGALAAILFGLDKFHDPDLDLIIPAGLVSTGLLCAIGYVAQSRRVSRPALDLSLLRHPTYRMAIVGGTLFRITTGAMPFLLPLMLQLGLGVSAMTSGSLTFAAALGSIGMKAWVPKLLSRFGFRSALTSNAVIAAALISGYAFVGATTAFWIIWTLGFFSGISRSLQFAAVNTLAYAEIEKEETSRANTLYAVVQQVSVSLGVAISSLILTITMWLLGTDAPPDMAVFNITFVVMALFALASSVMFLQLPTDAGATLSGHRPPIRSSETAD